MTAVNRSVVRGARGLLVVLTTVGVLASCSSDSAGAEVVLESASTVGNNPFTPSVAVTAVAEFPTDVRAVGSEVLDGTDGDGATVEGTAAGLYGGSGDAGVCDTTQLVEFLEGDEAKAEAWASVFDIDPESIGTFVAGLTPVYLTVDTLVTNHGYRDGEATSFTAVLEAGTAVLVDSNGVPRVKCGCGNPLAPAPAGVLDDAEYEGDAWEGFEPAEVVEVQPGPSVDSLEVVDLETGEPVEIPVGSEGGTAAGTQGWVLVASPEFDYDVTTISTSPDGVTWTEVEQAPDLPEQLAEGPDGWLGTRPGSREIYASEDLVSWTPVATQPPGISGMDLAFGNGRFVLVGGYPAIGGDGVGGVFTSPDGVTWTQADLPGAVVRSAGLDTVTFIDETGFVASGGGYTLVSPDGEAWTQVGARQELDDYVEAGVVAGEGETLLRNEYLWCNGDCEMYSENSTQEGLDGPLEPVTDAPFDEVPIEHAAYGDGQFLAATFRFGDIDDGAEGLYASTHGRDWELVAPRSTFARPDDYVRGLAYGTISSGEDPASPPPAGGDGELRGVDWDNRAFEACEGITEVQPVPLQDGTFEAEFGYVTLGKVAYGDADGDGAEDALVPITCSAGTAGGTIVEFRVFSAGPDGPTQLGEMFPGTQGTVGQGVIVDGAVQVTQDKFLPGDPFCCPSGGRETVAWTYQDGEWVQS